MAETALMSQSKTALAKRVASLNNRIRREKESSAELGERVADLMGGGVAFATAAGLGFLEGRFRNNDRSPLSLGPIPLTLAAAASASGIAIATGSRWANAAANGAFGAYGHTIGLAAGNEGRVKRVRRVSGIGDELMEDEEAEHYFGS
ncbi:MAG: hypothetical protein B7733_18675 [Myxococcales bacterium FL481]|nr:MAG: hypothetical protein B7733_18675 [Myxococcales bacterium FL481]